MTSDHVSAIRLRIHELSWSVKVETTMTMVFDKPFKGLSLGNFDPRSFDEVLKILKHSATKTCYLDPLPINLSRNVIAQCWYLILLTS